ncbi:hypothetical protein ABZ926_14930 [Streptomyces litmocidini]|uniref:hypothetical protein n=1 Tax=Streptomyces litmocidini TaxID=67318 RepID=UPI00340B6C61
MIKNLMRGIYALSLALSPLAVPHAALAASTEPAAAEVLTLAAAIGQIPVADESRDGYERTKFKHWNAGLAPVDGCNTRVICMLESGLSASSLVHDDLSLASPSEAQEAVRLLH